MMTVALLTLVLGAGALGAQEPERQTASKTEVTSAATVNLNTATIVQLESLPGIGTRTAERIVEYRQKNGGFKKVEETLEIRSSCPYSLSVSDCGARHAV
ncbi:MAG: helix-hairpin-helix domain-containing protein, partial [Vicinamibacterales bacterium]